MGAKESPQLRSLQAVGQVAAVCYRIGKSGIEFLLVQTRGGRWTFPKGNTEPGLTPAQSAALEAFEEAGVHGRMEEDYFTRYVVHKRGGASGSAQIMVYSHLCEVMRLEPPQESKRNPTWFPATKAKRRLHEGRVAESGAEFARVVDCAVARFQRLRTLTPSFAPTQKDPLQKVPFEAGEALADSSRLQEAALVRDFRRRGDLQRSAIQLAVDAYLGDILRLGPTREQVPEIDGAWSTQDRAKALGPGRKNTPKQLPN
jgi:8-oxo-dGTP pyrophosphatase MutT (NUDIX family)